MKFIAVVNNVLGVADKLPQKQVLMSGEKGFELRGQFMPADLAESAEMKKISTGSNVEVEVTIRCLDAKPKASGTATE